MLKKQLLKIIILLVAVLALCGVYFGLVRPMLKEPDEEVKAEFDADGDRLGTSDRPYIYDVIPQSELKSIYVKNDLGEYRFNMDTVAGTLVLEGCEELSFDAEMLSYLYVNTCNTLAMAKVQDALGDLAEYGLEKGREGTYFEVTENSGKVHTVFVGDKIPTGAGYYVKAEDKPFIYVLDTMVEKCVMADENVYVAPILALRVPENDRYSVDNIRLARDGELVCSFARTNGEDKDETGAAISHVMTYPTGYNANQAVLDDILAKLVTFVGDKVIDCSVTTEELDAVIADYGFASPSHELLYEYGGVERRVIFGKETEDGSGYYVLNTAQHMLCTVPKESVDFIDFDILKFIDSYIFQMSIDSVESVKLSTRMHSETFRLSGEKKELAVTRETTGEKVDTYSFRQTFIDILLVNLDDYAEAPEEPVEVLSYTITTRGGNTYEYKFYDLTTRKLFFTVNGVGQFCVGRDEVDKVVADLELLLRGEKVVSEALK